jgi:hypothetical protein
MRKVLFAFVAMLSCNPIAMGQCSSGNCGGRVFPVFPLIRPVERPSTVAANVSFEWKQEVNVEGATLTVLYRNGERVGAVTADNVFYPYDDAGRSYGPPFAGTITPAKVTENVLEEQAKQFEGCTVKDEKLNFGVDVGRLVNDTPSNTLPDDLGKMSLTVRSDNTDVINSVKHVADQFKDTVKFQAYPPGHWALEPGLDFGLVHLEGPVRTDGKAVMVHNQNDFNDGEAGLIKAIRKADPTFKADVVPDLRSDSRLDSVLTWLKSPSPLGGVPWYVILGGGALVFFIARRNGKG